MAKTLDRTRLRKLLGMLSSPHDGEVLNAARLIDEMMRSAGQRWDMLIADDDSPAPEPRSADLERLDQLLLADSVSDVLKIRLRHMRHALRQGTLAEADRRLLRILHRKAVIDGAIVEA
jgi:hypothetical protein